MSEINSNTSFDSPWKEVVEAYLPDFVAFFFPNAHTAIDWDKGFEFLDQELQQVVRDAELGKRLVDKLVKVFLHDGEEAWILLHIEIQNQYEQSFEERIFIYNYRIYDKYRRNVISLVVLGDESQTWRPSEYRTSLLGCGYLFTFLTVKLLDFAQETQTLTDNANPFAVVVLAHLTAKQTRKNETDRYLGKLSITRQLYQRNFSRQDVLNLYRFIDWVMRLPEALEQEYLKEVRQFEEEKRMPYITNAERFGIRQGEANLVIRQLNRRIGSLRSELESQIRQLSVGQLEDLGEALLDFSSEQDLVSWLEVRS